MSIMKRASVAKFVVIVWILGNWVLHPSLAQAQTDERTKLCEVRPGCSVLVPENGKCIPRSVEGGTCSGGLLEGAVVNRFSASPRNVVKYHNGKWVGYSLRVYGGATESGALNFMLTEVDALGRTLPMRNAAFGCTITPDAELEDFHPESQFDRACQEAIAWLGADAVMAAFKESGPMVPTQASNPSPASSRVTGVQPATTTRLADDPKVSGGSAYGK
jgi:hypothetical protein